jgi:tetratricopeptide (TPR) repeat protein
VKRLALLATLLVASVADANVWQHAISAGTPDRAQDIYDSEMKSGDELTLLAMTQVSADRLSTLIERAVTSYRNAAAAKPKEGEPYFRIGRVLYSFYFECNNTMLQRISQTSQTPNPCAAVPGMFDRKHAQEIIDAWDAFEARAPLDPRLSVMHEEDNTVLFHRAVLHTQMNTKDHLEAATRDYEKYLARSERVDETVLSNLAEAYMMEGRLEEAIDTYREALRMSAQTETLYGLAVALDRDERSASALELIASQGESSMQEFHTRVDIEHRTFFVPAGEKYYYYALAYEAFGQSDNAIDAWQRYIASGAHPEYQPRAKAHLEPLLAQRKRQNLHLEAPWHELFH